MLLKEDVIVNKTAILSVVIKNVIDMQGPCKLFANIFKET